MAVLDTRCDKYQHACLATIQSTLNAGTVFVTLFPNFNISLADPTLATALKVQVQITGCPMTQEAIIATLHTQFAYRLQDHSIDLAYPVAKQDSLLITVDPGQTPCCYFVPKQLSRDELLHVFPDKWITHYEKTQTQSTKKPLQVTTPSFSTRSDGSIEIEFPSSHAIQSQAISEPPSQLLIEPCPIPIHSFDSQGNPIYERTLDNGHLWYDPLACTCSDCVAWSDDADDDYFPRRRKNGKKSSQELLRHRYEQGDKTVGLLGEPSGKFDYYVTYSTPPSDYPPAFMLHSISDSYEDHFPSLQTTSSTSKQSWKIRGKKVQMPDGSQEIDQPPIEQTLNWQSENALAQNKLLHTIATSQQQLEKRLDHQCNQNNQS